MSERNDESSEVELHGDSFANTGSRPMAAGAEFLCSQQRLYISSLNRFQSIHVAFLQSARRQLFGIIE